MSTLRLGLIGAGNMGLSLARAAKERDDVRFVAVADPMPEAAQKAAAELGGAALTAYPDLLAREEVDAVLVATPNFAHREVVVAAAAAGKQIFCEKPMALCVADCDEMIAAAQRAGVKLMVGQVLRLNPGFARARQLACSGELGRPLSVAVERSSFWGLKGWRLQRELTGGVLFEVNVHELDFMRAVLGDAQSVFAAIPDAMIPESDIPGINYVTVQFKNGGVGLLNSNVLLPQGQYQVAITCERGSIRCGWSNVEYQVAGGEKQSIPADELAAMPRGVAVEIGSFVDWVLRDKPPIVTAQDGRAAVELAEAANRSGASRQPVALPL